MPFRNTDSISSRLSQWDASNSIIRNVGRRFGRILVTGYAGITISTTGHRTHYYSVACDCGEVGFICFSNLAYKGSKSCGCLRAELMRASKRTHGHKTNGIASKTYSSWQMMRNRCYRNNFTDYPNYGGRGIVVCERWRNSFEAFVLDMGERPSGCTLDRKDTNGNYEPGNCRWATNKEQSNNRRSNISLLLNGVKVSLKQASEILRIPYGAVQYRMHVRKMTPMQSLGCP